MENLKRAQKETEEFSEEMRQRVEKAKTMDISELKGTVLQRCQELTDEEAGILQTIEQHPVGEIIMKLIGPELEQIFSEPESETEQMLADDMPKRLGARERIMPQGMPRDMPRDQMFADDPNNPSAERMDPDDPRLKRPRPEETQPMLREMASR